LVLHRRVRQGAALTSGFQALLLACRPALRRELRAASQVRRRVELPQAESLPVAAQVAGPRGEPAAASGFVE
jgi:hypothetical protein